ncbi:hypothetical protein CONPUDRAFT_159297 [Coniophora puteana RWD-64-598 SS2]|uniref:Uncharacterized protein n=1 Tax=Coniophora puteana (strain RWD-64-598) TaxID=741705 RepID=A0A5M3M8R0_CONPW|nr:uncharacterized protein CONPUDRAFT_159297 [Coniophora puteana RWD-64-598 SS2]EIW75165.1 hypothetical protein CONPUDRAFT_159297 [Coniophora puteana RWD-64-598 SS2]
MPRSQKPKPARSVRGNAPTFSKPPRKTPTGIPRVMRNRWEQYVYDKYGDGPAFEEIYISDEQLNKHLRLLNIPESQLADYRREYDTLWEGHLDSNGGKVICQGMKPWPDADPSTDHICVVHIPDKKDLVIRIWDGGLEEEGQFCLDVYDMDAQIAINTSELGFSFNVVPLAGTLSVLCGGRLQSWEARTGCTPEQILPGEERFSVIEGAYLALCRPNLDPFWFKIPTRNRVPPGIEQAASPVPLY